MLYPPKHLLSSEGVLVDAAWVAIGKPIQNQCPTFKNSKHSIKAELATWDSAPMRKQHQQHDLTQSYTMNTGQYLFDCY